MSARGLRLDGSLIRTIRENQGYTLRDCAARAEISPAFLSNIELGHKQASPPTAKRLSEVLGVSIGDIRDDDEDHQD